jgi:hypothetical protein
MANIRDLKKDVKQMVHHLILECYSQLVYSPPLHQENVLDIISDTLELGQETVYLINHPNSDSASDGYKNYYQNLTNDFYDKVIELTERLNSLNY